MFCSAVWLLHFPLLSSVGKSRRQSPCCCSLPASQGPSHPSSRLTNLGCLFELLITPLCEDVGFDTTPSTRTFTREQESLLHGAGIPPWCSHKSFEPSVGAPGAGWNWKRQSPGPGQPSGADLPFHISGDELLQSSLTAASAKVSALHDWGELNVWLFLVPLQPEAFSLMCGEDQDCTLSWRNQSKPSFFCVFPFLGAHLEMCWISLSGSHLCEFGGRCGCHNHQISVQMFKALPGPVGFIPCAKRRGCSPVSHPQAEAEEGLCAG